MHEQIGPRTWKIVEEDAFGQFPFLYCLVGVDKCIVIDTGCGRSNLRAFLDTHINRRRLPYLVVCTHVHFDVRALTVPPCNCPAHGITQHIGGNHFFTAAPAGGARFRTRRICALACALTALPAVSMLGGVHGQCVEEVHREL